MISLENKTLKVSKRMKAMPFCNSETGEAEQSTKFYFGFDDSYLYFKFICAEDYFYPVHTDYNAPLYEGDIVELMLTLGDKNKYLEVEVNQNNANYCVTVVNRDGNGAIELTKLSKNLVCSNVKVYEKKWECDIIIETERLLSYGFDPSNAYFNAHRQSFNQMGELHLESLSPTMSQSFHRTDAFLRLRFGD